MDRNVAFLFGLDYDVSAFRHLQQTPLTTCCNMISHVHTHCFLFALGGWTQGLGGRSCPCVALINGVVKGKGYAHDIL